MRKLTALLLILSLLVCGSVLAAEETEKTETLQAWLLQQALVPDGTPDEPQWAVPAQLRDGARIWAAWEPGTLRLALEYGDAREITLSLDTKTWTFALEESIAEEGISGAAIQGQAELAVDLAAAGVTVLDYNDAHALGVTLDDGDPVEFSVVFTGTCARQQPFTGSTFSKATVSEDQQTLTLGSATGGYHVVQNIAAIDHSKDIVLRQQISVEALPVSAGTIPSASATGTGYYFTVSDNDTGAESPVLFANLFNNGTQLMLRFRCGASGSTAYRDVPLGKTVGSDFCLEIIWTAQDAAVVYVDGQPVGTAENVTYQNSSFGRNALSSRYAGGAARIQISRRVLAVVENYSVLDHLDFADICGSNLTQDKITNPLQLPATVTDSLLGTRELVWSSSVPEVIGTDGAVREVRQDTDVTLTASLKDRPASAKSFRLTVPRLTMDAVLAVDTVNMDGALAELHWSSARTFSVTEGNVTGSLRAAWNRGKVYLGLEYQNARTATILLNATAWTVDLTSKFFEEGITGAAGQGTGEFTIDLAAAGITLTDYNQMTDLQVTLTGPDGSAKLSKEPLGLVFTGIVTNRQPFSGTTFSNATVSADQQTLTLGSGRGYHVVQNIAAIDHSKDILLKQRIHAAQLPVSEGTIPGASATGTGYYFTVSDYEGGTQCPVLFGNLFNNGTQLILRFRYGSSGATTYKDVPLGKTVGSTFDLEVLWTAGDAAIVYVDGELAGRAEGITYYNKSFGRNALSSRYEGAAADVRVSGRMLTVPQYDSVSEELTVEALLHGTDLLRLDRDLVLPGSFTSQYLGELPLTWSSSDETVLTNAGKVTKPEGTLGRYITLTLLLDGREIWTEDVFVLPESPFGAASPAILDAAFTAETVVLDGSLEEEGWSMNTELWDDNVSYGSVGVQWDASYLYIAVQTGSDSPVISLNNSTLDLSGAKKEDGCLELAVPWEDLELAVTDYGLEIPAKITAGSGSWVGTIRLTGTDWYLTDSTTPRTEATGASISLAGGTVLPAYQNADQTDRGWHFYDLYAPDGSAGEYVRTYRIFSVPQLADRTKATWMEANILVESMPVHDLAEATNWSGSYASYGLCWSLSDQRVDGLTNTVMMGIFNTENGLLFAVKGQGTTMTAPLNRYVGQHFRLASCWETDGSLTLWVDGQRVKNFENVTNTMSGMGSNNLIMNLIRDRNAAAADKNDDMSIWMEDLSLGCNYGQTLLDSLTFAAFAGTNTDPGSITADLALPDSLRNSQLTGGSALTWSSSRPDVLSNDGKVTVPRYSTVVELTARTAEGKAKTFILCVKGSQIDDSVLVARRDWNPAVGTGTVEDVYPFILDTDNNSIIRDLKTEQNVNVVVLTDRDTVNRLHESVLTLWVSSDNITYTQVKNFKLLRSGEKTYLYDFSATGRYVKVHCTHYQGDRADFLGLPSEMIDAYREEIFGAGEGSFREKTVTVTNGAAAAAYDSVWTLEGEYQRVLLGDSLLYHYTRDGKTYVRIPRIDPEETVTLTVLWDNAEALDTANEESVYEVLWGTREARVITDTGRWITGLPDGSLFAIDGRDVKDGNIVLYRYLLWSRSWDGGMTWTEPVEIVCQEGDYNVSGGGVTYDPNTGRIVVVSFQSDPPVSKLFFLYSDDLGATWHICPDVAVEGDAVEYALTYTPPTVLSCHDGAGENIDLVLPVATIFNEEGSFCIRVVYSCDAGLTWTMGEDQINYTGEGLYRNESGTSEGTILERSDGKLVLYARCQYDSVNFFACATSDDFGKSWTEAELSHIYTVNTQPMACQFGDLPLLVWGGNNAMGGNSYMRFPMSIGIFTPDLMGVEQIQDLYSRYSLQGTNRETMNKITNPSVAHSGDSLTISWWANTGRLIMKVDDLANYLLRTKGAWDSFEDATAGAEGWSATWGEITEREGFASRGSRSMELTPSSAAVRSIPWLQKGTVSMDLYVGSDPADMTIELESAYSDVFGKAAPIALKVESGVLGGVPLKTDAWNHLEFTLDLAAETPVATLQVNGQPADILLNTDAGNYICYVEISAKSGCCLDAFLVEDKDSVELTGTPEADLPGFSGWLTLNETIDLCVLVPEGIDPESSVIQVVSTETGEPRNFSLEKNTQGKWFLRCSMQSDRMNEDVTIIILDARGDPLTQSTTISIASFASKMLSLNLSDDLNAMLIRMLDYGALAQRITQPDAVNLANNVITRQQRAFIDSYDMGTPESYDPQVTPSGGVFSANLTLNESVDMNIYVNPAKVGENEKLVVKLDGVALAEGQYQKSMDSSGMIRIRYSFHADKMNRELTVAVVDRETGMERVSLDLSIRKYVHLCLNSYSDNTNLCTMLVAMLDYGALAQRYAGINTGDLANRYVTAQQRKMLTDYPWPNP